MDCVILIKPSSKDFLDLDPSEDSHVSSLQSEEIFDKKTSENNDTILYELFELVLASHETPMHCIIPNEGGMWNGVLKSEALLYGAISTMASTSTHAPKGNAATPTAVRACRPLSPNTCSRIVSTCMRITQVQAVDTSIVEICTGRNVTHACMHVVSLANELFVCILENIVTQMKMGPCSRARRHVCEGSTDCTVLKDQRASTEYRGYRACNVTCA